MGRNGGLPFAVLELAALAVTIIVGSYTPSLRRCVLEIKFTESLGFGQFAPL
jgi:hypothetical protein